MQKAIDFEQRAEMREFGFRPFNCYATNKPSPGAPQRQRFHKHQRLVLVGPHSSTNCINFPTSGLLTERIHRSNLVGMGMLPLQFKEGASALALKLDGTETFDVVGLDANIKPQQDLTLKITRKDGKIENISVRCRIDTPIEIDYYQHGGILPFVLRQLVAKA
jgi:hypothetical protein